MIDETKLDLDDWKNSQFGSGMSDDYRKGFNDSLYLVRSQVHNVNVAVSEQEKKEVKDEGGR